MTDFLSSNTHTSEVAGRVDQRTKFGKGFKFLLLALFFILIMPARAEAYIGPGAGFAVAGSFLAIFGAVFAGMIAVFTWPIRYAIRAIRGRHAFARSRIKKFVILGLDGMDHGLTEKFLAEGKLPNFAKLREQGDFKPLATTVPSISPVAWSSFQTGVNPGKHNIFDFLTRDKNTYQPKLSSVDIRGPRRMIKFGNFQFPIGKADIRLLRKGKPFWVTLGEHGLFSSVLRVPITFPPEKFYGVQLSGMCVPDLRGTQGMFSFYTTRDAENVEHTGGENYYVKKEGNVIRADLIGCNSPFRADGGLLKAPFTVTINDTDSAQIKINGDKYTLKKHVYTDWIKVDFKAGMGIKVHGICRFMLLNTEPEFELYVTPINIDPESPAMPLTHPVVYSTYLAKRQGSFATLGLAEDSWALNEKVLDDNGFMAQCISLDEERESMFFDSLDKVKQGLCVCVFDGTDRIQHTFWRDIDDEHPARENHGQNDGRNAILELYERMDTLVGKTMEQCRDKDTVLMIISDHGFSTFRHGVDLNRWLEENGYLKLKEGEREGKYLSAVDWSQTRAFASGLSGIFLNIKGRESQGIVDPGAEAAQLREEIAAKLTELHHPERNESAVKRVYNALKVYRGPYKGEAPDLLVGFNKGYRASWETAIGEITEKIFHPNTKAWSGDHCIDPSLVPGVLFSNRRIDSEHARLMDIGPTVLDMFGVKVPKYMDGKSLAVADADGSSYNTKAQGNIKGASGE
ncbi:MAG: alkaline phosphatase family protein [Planctomycetota bacterium]|jgi:predicted AlkP superfamily phosphohydrolase/phosphomutase